MREAEKMLRLKKNYPVMDAVDESIADSCETILKIGGYIILFSIITSIIEYIIPEKYDVAGCIACRDNRGQHRCDAARRE